MQRMGTWNMHGGLWESPTTALDPPEYVDDNGVHWAVEWHDRGDGWVHFQARPMSGQDDAAFQYGIKADEYPVTGLVAKPSGGVTDVKAWADSYKFVAEAVDDWTEGKKPPARGGSKGGTFLLVLLALWLIGSDKRRYHGARDEQVF